MKNLKRLTLSSTLMFVLALTAFAGETLSPPCNPGQTESPPCSSQSLNGDTTDPEQTPGPSASDNVDLIDIVEAAFWSLLLF